MSVGTSSIRTWLYTHTFSLISLPHTRRLVEINECPEPLSSVYKYVGVQAVSTTVKFCPWTRGPRPGSWRQKEGEERGGARGWKEGESRRYIYVHTCVIYLWMDECSRSCPIVRVGVNKVVIQRPRWYRSYVIFTTRGGGGGRGRITFKHSNILTHYIQTFKHSNIQPSTLRTA